ncbi:MAG: hypothetical protein WCS94_24155 [Verrucomicrobiota bacterium]
MNDLFAKLVTPDLILILTRAFVLAWHELWSKFLWAAFKYSLLWIYNLLKKHKRRQGEKPRQSHTVKMRASFAISFFHCLTMKGEGETLLKELTFYHYKHK